jgi:hypothetical protein
MFNRLRSNKALNAIGGFVKKHPRATTGIGVGVGLAGLFAYGALTAPQAPDEYYRWLRDKGGTHEEAVAMVRQAQRGSLYGLKF